MLEALQSLREELTAKKQTEVDQTSFPASKPGTSSTAVNLDLPPPRPRTNIQTEDMDVDYGPALPPCLVLDPHDTSDQYVATSELPPKKVSDKPKKHIHSCSRHEIESRSASDQSIEESDEPRIPSTKPKKHSDKSKHKSRSKYVSSSSGEDQSPVARHRSSKPSWLKLQDLILRHVLTARCLMSLIGLLASTEKMVPPGRLHMRPF